MRTAIMLSGHMRTYKDCYKSLLESVVKPYGADVFVSTWDTLGYSSNKPPHVYKKVDLPIGETTIREAYGDFLKAVKVESAKDFVEVFHRKNKMNTFTQKPNIEYKAYHNTVFGHIVPRSYSMWYKVNDCNLLRKEYEAKNGFVYDLVIRCRPDLYFMEPFSTYGCDVSKDDLFIPGWENYRGWNDQFAFGNSRVMDTYCHLYHHIDQYISEGLDVGNWAEGLLERHCKGYGLPHKIARYVVYRIVRRPSEA